MSGDHIPQRRGRRKGSKNKSTIAMAAIIEEKLGDDCFKGDAHDFLIYVYKNRTVPIQLRIDAAKAAARYEKPQLETVTYRGDENQPVRMIIEWQKPSE